MQIESNIVVKSSYHNKPIVTDIFYNVDNTKKPIVIFCHGYKGFKDWGSWDLVAKMFAETNHFFIKFNFSHNGETLENPIDFPDLEAFGENNITTELNDLEDVINWIITNEKYKSEVDITDIILIGHSRGGGIVTIKASENKKVSRVISWNGVSDYALRFPKGKDLEEWEKEGVLYVLNGRTKQQMPHKYQFYQDFKDNEERLSIKTAVENLNKPQLIISGTHDEVVKPIEAKNMHLWNPKSKLLLIEGMNHTLGGMHPWNEEKLPIHLEKAVQMSIDFINK
ncbi:MAG: alpha/beta hydrolase [Flavobacteriaceae bacterium]|nr:alpha/beta hydrolase [Flavobacteriaceae bacterium]